VLAVGHRRVGRPVLAVTVAPALSLDGTQGRFAISPPEEEDAASGTNLQRRCREEEGALELKR
jgi:hypothetical protein